MKILVLLLRASNACDRTPAYKIHRATSIQSTLGHDCRRSFYFSPKNHKKNP